MKWIADEKSAIFCGIIKCEKLGDVEMSLLKIIDIILIIVLLIIGIETIIKFKKNENKLIEYVRKPLLIRIDIIICLIIAIAILTLINIFSAKNISGIENYDKNYYLKEYGGDLDSTLSIFPDDKLILKEADFTSSFQTNLFDSDGYIILKSKYSKDNFDNEINRIKTLNATIYENCNNNAKTYTNYIKYDDKSYIYPAYTTIDGFGHTYEYALVNNDDLEIIYVYLAHPSKNNINYKDYLKKDKSIYSVSDTLDMFSMYNYSFDNGNSFMEFGDCEKSED